MKTHEILGFAFVKIASRDITFDYEQISYNYELNRLYLNANY